MPDLPLVGDEFAGYRLRAVLGRGGMSTVFQAENPRLGNVIALKVLAPELASDDIFRTRFLEESRIAASMNHPNVIPIHDMGASDGLLYIVMRYVTGSNLQQMIKKRGRLQPETAVFLLGQAARALDAAHAKGLVHRDVKPANLLVEQSNDDTDPDHLYLADFGITKRGVARTGLTSTGEFIGTVDYVAPEQIMGMSALGMADQYSLGCVLYECLTGRLPFEKYMDMAVLWAHVQEQPAQPTTLRPDLPPAVDELFARVLAKEPGDRYRDCREFVDAARAALGVRATAPSASAPRTPPPATPPPATAPAGHPPAEAGYAAATAVDYPPIGSPAGYSPTETSRAAATPAGYAAASVAPGQPAELAHEAEPAAPSRDSTLTSHRRPPSSAPPGGGDGPGGGQPPGRPGWRRGWTVEDCGLIAPSPYGEVGWNHNEEHPRNYTAAEMAAGKVPYANAAGRVACVATANASEDIIWTDDIGNMLGVATGNGPVASIWYWWVAVHHWILFPGTPSMASMNSCSVAMAQATGCSVSSMPESSASPSMGSSTMPSSQKPASGSMSP
jgi:serine/threonine protein kinase